MAVTASPDRRALSPVATLPTMPRPCKQETTPRNSGPRACAQLQPRRLGCGTQRPHDDGGLQNYDTPHWGRSAEPSFTTLPPQCRQRRGEGRWAGYRLGLPVGGGTPGLSPAGPPHQGYPTATARPGKTRPEICRGVVYSALRPSRQPRTKGTARGRRNDPKPGSAAASPHQRPGAHTGHRDGQRSRPSQGSPQQPRAPASTAFSQTQPGTRRPGSGVRKPWSSSAESLTAN